MSKPLPENLLAALLFNASEDFDLKNATRLISSGRWSVEADYEFEGKNLVELAASNINISRRPQLAIDLMRALLEAGVKAREDAWLKTPDDYFSAYLRLFLRGMGQGAHEDRLSYACKALAMIQPIKPVKDHAEKIVGLIKKAGGFHVPLQGLDLISWMALHDFDARVGGCGCPHGNDDEKTTRRRVQSRVFAHKDIDRKSMSLISGMLLDYRVADLDPFRDKSKGFSSSGPDVIMAAIEQVNTIDDKLISLVGARAYEMLQDMCILKQGNSYYHTNITQVERADQLQSAFAIVVPIAARSNEFCPNFAWIMTERPEMIGSLFTQMHALEKAGVDLVAMSAFGYDQKTSAKIIAAAGVLRSRLLQCKSADRERVLSLMDEALSKHPPSTEGAKGTQDIFRRFISGARMELNTQPARETSKASPRL